MDEQEKLIRETINPALYNTFRRIILKDEQEKVEKMRLHNAGCTEKCRLKNMANEVDLKRNQDLVKCLLEFPWCDRCKLSLDGTDALSPPSGGD